MPKDLEKTIAIADKSTSKAVSKSQVSDSIVAYLRDGDEGSFRLCKSCIARWIMQTTARFARIMEKYNVVYLLSDRPLRLEDSDTIYRTVTSMSCEKEKPLLLVLQSYGGRIEPAYFIGKILGAFKDLHIAVPRMAKSAATLVCCAASRIHMGGLSELGPIDPQINGVPALGLKNTIQHLAELTVRFPEATNLFIGYMCKSVDPMDLGYYERIVESSMQYAERLLQYAHPGLSTAQTRAIAQKLTYDYKDHGFVIDRQEASNVFPSGSICFDTDEYGFSDIVYKEIEWMRQVAKSEGYLLSFVGCGVDAPSFHKIPSKR